MMSSIASRVVQFRRGITPKIVNPSLNIFSNNDNTVESSIASRVLRTRRGPYTKNNDHIIENSIASRVLRTHRGLDNENDYNKCDLLINDTKLKTTSLNKSINTNIINKGTGAGGFSTNINGLPYEEITDLKTEYTVINDNRYYTTVRFNNSNTDLIYLSKTDLFKYMISNGNKDTTIEDGHGCKQPDECYINEATNTCIIIEKKFQQCSGSICEKIQTPDFKLWQYQRIFPRYNIHYIYCLTNWFKDNCKAELAYLEYKNIPVFWGDDKNYKSKIIRFILNLS